MSRIKEEESKYQPIPIVYNFGDDRNKEIILNRKFKSVDNDIKDMIAKLLDKQTK